MRRLLLTIFALFPSVLLAQPAPPLILKQGQVAQAGSSDSIRITGSPEFSNSAYSGWFQTLVGGASPGSLYTSQQVGQQATEAVVGAIDVPAGVGVHQTNAIAGYIVSNRARPNNGGDVAGYFQAGCNATNCSAFGLNPLVYDGRANRGQIIGNEFDFNRIAPDTIVNGVNLVLVSNAGATGTANGFACRTTFGTGRWNNCNVVADGAVSQYSYFIGATSSAANSDTQPIGLVSYNARSVRYIATILGDRFGGLDLRPGVTGGSITFQENDGSANLAFVNSTAFAMSVPVILKNYTVASLPTCSTALKGGMAFVTDAASPSYNAALTGGGAAGVPVACDGTRWTSH